MAKCGVAIENTTTKWQPGVSVSCVKFAPILQAADGLMTYNMSSEMYKKHGKSVTFMPKLISIMVLECTFTSLSKEGQPCSRVMAMLA